MLPALAISAPSYAVPECDCSHLAALRQELRNARTLQMRYRQEAERLRQMERDASQNALQAFAQQEAGAGIQAPPGYSGPDRVEYTAYGDNISVDSLEGHSNEALCAFSRNTVADLAKVYSGSNCTDIAEAVRAHEEYHRSQCAAIGYRAYLDMHGADHASEEVNAYEAQAQRLREGIRHVLEKATVEVWLDNQFKVTSPPRNPLYSAISMTSSGRIKTTGNASGQNELRFEGSGSYRFDFTPLGGHCSPKGVPTSIQAHAAVITDGETARVSWEPTGNMPQFGMECRLNGQKGYGMSIPVPMDPHSSAVNELPLAFEDGEKITADVANTPAAHVISGAGLGMSMSGQSEIGIHIECPAGQ